ncbi:palmdelphin-like [Xiphias gladius]|uniref:palmdelphin-like n=1 Tax=Xiphias gladius TaxID=8245 RepID=UPI001A98F131|nr:palmdelphin-like [Xiphias gladius]
MEESDLLKERLQAITDKHHIQEDIRQKKLELDQEKLKLQHLKKKALREQWLLQDSATHNTTDSPQQQSLLSDQRQTRALQLNIHRIEMEVEFLERQESVISTNERFILNRLKALEKSPEEIIKEAQENFVLEPLQVTTVIPDVPESIFPPANNHTEQTTPRNSGIIFIRDFYTFLFFKEIGLKVCCAVWQTTEKWSTWYQRTNKALFTMKINVTNNLLTGESTVLSNATVPPKELNQNARLKVYDDGRKCFYALNSQEGSHNLTCVSEPSSSKVEQLLRSATVYCQVNHQNYHQNPSRREEHCFYNHQDEKDRAERCDLRNQGEHCGNHVLSNNTAEEELSCREHWHRKPQDDHCFGNQGSHYSKQEERQNKSNLREGHRFGNQEGVGCHYGNQKDHHYSLYQVRNCHNAQEDRPTSHHSNGVISCNKRVNGGRPSGFPPPKSHDQEAVSAYQPQLCYTPANYIPIIDYISVDEEELYCYRPPSYQSYSQTENSHNQSTALYSGPTPSDRVPSPLCGDDTPYTILNTMENIEPITAIFMGFQMAQNDSGWGQEFGGSLKAELVIIEDNEENVEDKNMREKKRHAQLGVSSYSTESAANESVGCVEGFGDRVTGRRVGPGIKRIQKKHKPCCIVC